MRLGSRQAVVPLLALLGAMRVGAQPPATPQASSPPAAQAAANIEYRNARYGFCFVLPASWTGFSIVPGQWTGGAMDGGPPATGPLLLIRQPAWTADNPREDIPIMIFTPGEWRRIEKDGLSVSAAPIGPSELGHNARYVFALPARYNFDFATGYEEVDGLIGQHALHAPCAADGKQRESNAHPKPVSRTEVHHGGSGPRPAGSAESRWRPACPSFLAVALPARRSAIEGEQAYCGNALFAGLPAWQVTCHRRLRSSILGDWAP